MNEHLAHHMSGNVARGSIAMSVATLAMVSTPALAHHAMDGATPETFAQGLLSGLAHPVIGLDHLAFLVVATLLAYALKGPARFLAPLAFVVATIGGTILHLGAAEIPMSESLVALTVLVAGILALTRRHPGAFLLSLVFAVSGVLHGYAYGESIVGAETGPLLAYLTGFALIQYGLIGAGIVALERLAAHSERMRATTARVGGIGATLTGALFLATGML